MTEEIEDNFLAGWAHFPIFLWVIGPIIVFPFAHSDYTKHQIKQALVWQLIWMIVLGGLLLLAYISTEFNTMWTNLFLGFFYLLGTVFISYSVYAAYKVFEGEEFSYPVIHYYIRR